MDKKFLFVREGTSISDDIFAKHPELTSEIESQPFFSKGRFTFVGVYYSEATNIITIAYPKYYPKSNTLSTEMQQKIIASIGCICEVAAQASNVLRKSVKESDFLFDTLPETEQQHWATPFELAQFIVDDYIQYGLYHEKSTGYREHHHGPVDWLHTIEKMLAIPGRDVLFPNLIKRTSVQKSSGDISQFQAWVVHECLELLNSIGLYQDIQPPEYTHIYSEDEVDAAIRTISKNLLRVYSSRKMLLLQALKAWCRLTVFQRRRFGVTSFEMIWEYATKQVFGNINKTKMPKPSYIIEGKSYKGTGKPAPDILRVGKAQGDAAAYIGILDAKYYCPVCGDEIINSAPSSADVVKQIGYLHLFKQLYPHPGIQYCNAFLLPSQLGKSDSLYEKVGYVTNGEEANKEIETIIGKAIPQVHDYILLYRVDPDRLFAKCLARSTVPAEQFYTDFIKPYQSLIKA